MHYFLSCILFQTEVCELGQQYSTYSFLKNTSGVPFCCYLSWWSPLAERWALKTLMKQIKSCFDRQTMTEREKNTQGNISPSPSPNRSQNRHVWTKSQNHCSSQGDPAQRQRDKTIEYLHKQHLSKENSFLEHKKNTTKREEHAYTCETLISIMFTTFWFITLWNAG